MKNACSGCSLGNGRDAKCSDESEVGYLAMEATVLIEAFDDTVRALGIDRNDELAKLVVAKHIITFAKAGLALDLALGSVNSGSLCFLKGCTCRRT